jgi:hypothetical protein
MTQANKKQAAKSKTNDGKKDAPPKNQVKDPSKIAQEVPENRNRKRGTTSSGYHINK